MQLRSHWGTTLEGVEENQKLRVTKSIQQYSKLTSSIDSGTNPYQHQTSTIYLQFKGRTT